MAGCSSIANTTLLSSLYFSWLYQFFLLEGPSTFPKGPNILCLSDWPSNSLQNNYKHATGLSV